MQLISKESNEKVHIYLCEEIMDSQNCEHLNYTDLEIWT